MLPATKPWAGFVRKGDLYEEPLDLTSPGTNQLTVCQTLCPFMPTLQESIELLYLPHFTDEESESGRDYVVTVAIYSVLTRPYAKCF